MEKFAKVINKFWVDSLVPMWRAKKMILDWEIETYEEIVEVESSRNTETPQTQVEFERNIKSKK